MNQPDNDVTIWTNSKKRFLAEEANYWIFANRIFYFLMFVGITAFFFKGWPIYLGIVLFSFSIGILVRRNGIYDGYFDGYEHGYSDCSYALKKTLNEILEKEDVSLETFPPVGFLLSRTYTLDELLDAIGWKEQDKKDYDQMIKKGLKNLGFSFKRKISGK